MARRERRRRKDNRREDRKIKEWEVPLAFLSIRSIDWMCTYILFILSCFLNLPICKRLRCAFDLHLRVQVPRLPQMPVSPNRRFVRECGSERGTRAPALVGERRRTLWPQCWKLRSEWIHRPLTTNKQCIEGSSNASVECSIKRAHTWSLSLWITPYTRRSL